MKNKNNSLKRIVFMLTLIISIIGTLNIVIGLECDKDSRPYIDAVPFKEEKFYWICELENKNEQFSCFSYIASPLGEILQVNPKQKYMEGVGVIEESFLSDDEIVNVYFTDYKLYENLNFTAGVICSSENGSIEKYDDTIVPYRRNPDEFVTRTLWVKDNYPFFIFIGVVFLVLIYLVIKFIKMILKW